MQAFLWNMPKPGEQISNFNLIECIFILCKYIYLYVTEIYVIL